MSALIRESSPEREVEFRARQVSGNLQYHSRELDLTGRGILKVALGYRRSRDFDPKDHAGQDDAALRADRDFVVGVVADGVSQSFFGNIAAEELVDFLSRELWVHRANPPSVESLGEILSQCCQKADARVKELRVSPGLPPMVVKALEAKRGKGTQAVFAAFVLNISKGLLCVFLVGDVHLLVKTAGAPIQRVEADKRGRWSSSGEARLLMERSEFENIEYVIAKSDGASPGLGVADLPSRDSFAETVRAYDHEDDVSFVAVSVLLGVQDGACPAKQERGEVQPGFTGDAATQIPVEQGAVASALCDDAACGNDLEERRGDSPTQCTERTDGGSGVSVPQKSMRAIDRHHAKSPTEGWSISSWQAVLALLFVATTLSSGFLSECSVERSSRVQCLVSSQVEGDARDALEPRQNPDFSPPGSASLQLPAASVPLQLDRECVDTQGEILFCAHTSQRDQVCKTEMPPPKSPVPEERSLLVPSAARLPVYLQFIAERWTQREFIGWFNKTQKGPPPRARERGLILLISCPHRAIPPIVLTSDVSAAALKFVCTKANEMLVAQVTPTTSFASAQWNVHVEEGGGLQAIGVRPQVIELVPRQARSPKNKRLGADVFLGYYRLLVELEDDADLRR